MARVSLVCGHDQSGVLWRGPGINECEGEIGKITRMSDGGETLISAIVPTHARLDLLSRTLEAILACQPAPAEILVHVDGGNSELYQEVLLRYPSVRCLFSEERIGPGGSRNRLIAAARHEWVANFDDDSYPARQDYFRRVAVLAWAFPDTAVFSSSSHVQDWVSPFIRQVSEFVGSGCVFNKRWFEQTRGFVPLPIAYGMEEVDVSLQLHCLGGRILHDPYLRVRHEPPLERDRDEIRITAAVLANRFLLPWLRYPPWLWAAGLVHVISQLRWMLGNERASAILPGLKMTLSHLREFRSFRHPVPSGGLLSWLRLRRSGRDVLDGRKLSHWQD